MRNSTGPSNNSFATNKAGMWAQQDEEPRTESLGSRCLNICKDLGRQMGNGFKSIISRGSDSLSANASSNQTQSGSYSSKTPI